MHTMLPCAKEQSHDPAAEIIEKPVDDVKYASLCQKRKEETTAFGISLARSRVLYQAAQCAKNLKECHHLAAESQAHNPEQDQDNFRYDVEKALTLQSEPRPMSPASGFCNLPCRSYSPPGHRTVTVGTTPAPLWV